MDKSNQDIKYEEAVVRELKIDLYLSCTREVLYKRRIQELDDLVQEQEKIIISQKYKMRNGISIDIIRKRLSFKLSSFANKTDGKEIVVKSINFLERTVARYPRVRRTIVMILKNLNIFDKLKKINRNGRNELSHKKNQYLGSFEELSNKAKLVYKDIEIRSRAGKV